MSNGLADNAAIDGSESAWHHVFVGLGLLCRVATSVFSCCGGNLSDASSDPKTHQVVELVDQPIEITDHFGGRPGQGRNRQVTPPDVPA